MAGGTPSADRNARLVESSRGILSYTQLTIHPFFDFNGRVTRLWLREILRRVRLPQVMLTVEGGDSRSAYFRALEAADASDWRPLAELWADRFAQLPPPHVLSA